MFHIATMPKSNKIGSYVYTLYLATYNVFVVVIQFKIIMYNQQYQINIY